MNLDTRDPRKDCSWEFNWNHTRQEEDSGGDALGLTAGEPFEHRRLIALMVLWPFALVKTLSKGSIRDINQPSREQHALMALVLLSVWKSMGKASLIAPLRPLHSFAGSGVNICKL